MSDIKANLLQNQQKENNQQSNIDVDKNISSAVNDFDEDTFEPSPFVQSLKERYEKFELKMKDSAGVVLFLIALFLVSTMNFVSNLVMPDNTIIEIAFVAFLVAFLINYYIIRTGNILPYIDNEDKNFSAKLIAFNALLSIVLLLFSFENAEKDSCIFVFLFSWVISFISEKIYSRNQINGKDMGFVILLTISGYLILQPKFLLDYQTSQQDGELTADQLLHKAEEYVNDQQIGLIASFLSALCFSYMCFNINKLNDRDFITLTHILCLIVILFLPVFFPIEGLNSPNLIQWGVMVLFGVIFIFVLQQFIRSSQIEQPSKLLGLLPAYLSMNLIYGMFLGNMPGFLQIGGIALAFVCCFFIFRNNYMTNEKLLNGMLDNYNNQLYGSTGIKGNMIELKNQSYQE